MIFAHVLKQLVRQGRVTLVDSMGRRHVIGQKREPGITIRVHDRATEWRLSLNPRLAVGEAYMAGTLTVEEGTVYDFLLLVARNVATAPPSLYSPFWNGLSASLRWLSQYNPIARARRNVAHHYDLSSRLYDLFLDADRQYSCAYFRSPNDDLETAQANKKRHIAAKLLLRPGMRVLDIGSGWGGLALYLARETGAHVTGLTLSVEQHRAATERAEAAGLADRVRFFLRDYREETGRYDRIVSVGMFEHVGVLHYQQFFEQVNRLLADDGIALIHAIGQRDGAYPTNPWILKYIFPGGYVPALSEVLPRVERADLWLTDLEILRLHYAQTLRHWRARFAAARDQASALYDERFSRMWEFYLAGAEAALREGGQMVFQMQLAKRIETVPLTRDYMADWESAHAAPIPEPIREAAE